MGKLDGSTRVLCVRADKTSSLLSSRRGFIASNSETDLLFPILRRGQFLPRTEALESDRSQWQVIPYAMLVNVGLIFAYRRSKQGAEGRLLGKASIGIGGHVESSDQTNSPTTMDTVFRAMLREVHEETGSETTQCANVHFNGYLVDQSNPVGQVHMGIVYTFEVRAETEIQPSEEIEPLGWYSPEELAGLDVEWESWSSILIDYMTRGLLIAPKSDPEPAQPQGEPQTQPEPAPASA